MSRQPPWERPEVRQAYNEADREEIGEFLKIHNLGHLSVRSHGQHLVIYLRTETERVPRFRFTRIGDDEYQLGIADHRNIWGMTPFTGTIAELFHVVTEQFSWLLTDE